MRCSKCGHKIWSTRALNCGLGEGCRRRVYRAARSLESSDSKPAKLAAELILDGGVQKMPGHGGRVWRTVSSKGSTGYLTTTGQCNCRQGLNRMPFLCHHRVAVIVMVEA